MSSNFDKRNVYQKSLFVLLFFNGSSFSTRPLIKGHIIKIKPVQKSSKYANFEKTPLMLSVNSWAQSSQAPNHFPFIFPILMFDSFVKSFIN